MKPRSPIPKLSPKRLASLSGSPCYSTIEKTRKPVKKVNGPRRHKEFKRTFHSDERCQWVKLQRCVACARMADHNHHIVTGGTGRRADYDKIIPLCWLCHALVHAIGRETFEQKKGIDFAQCAAETEQKWQSHLLSEGAAK